MSDARDDVERPKVFGDYYLLTTLARGGMGSIHLAKRLGFRSDIQRFFVVKKLRRGHANARELGRFHDEARVVVTLNHRALCHVFDVGVVNDEHYLAMELVEGVNLHHAMATMKLAPALALYVIDEILDALDYAHRHRDPATGDALQIVHRDVSPHNVMLSFQGAVKLIDFGLVSSTLKQEHTVGGVVAGKVEYMSPEQARAEPLDARSDVYAAAVIAYELLSGRRFYEGMSKGAVMTAVVDGSHIPPFDAIAAVAPALVAPLQSALAGEREARTSSCAALQAELAAAGPRASSRDLRDALERAMHDEKARLEALIRSFHNVGVDVDAQADDGNTQVTHIARSDEELDTKPPARDVSNEPTLIRPAGDVVEPPSRSPAAAMMTTEVTTTTTVTNPTDPANDDAPVRRAVPLALAVAALSAAAVIAIWFVVRGDQDGHTTRDVAVEVDAGSLLSGIAPVIMPKLVDAGSGVDDGALADGLVDGDDDDDSTAPTTTRPRKHKRTRPPNTPLPDLAAHLDYLARWCSRTSCARPVLAARGRIPLLDVVGLRTLRRDAEACVLECRR